MKVLYYWNLDSTSILCIQIFFIKLFSYNLEKQLIRIRSRCVWIAPSCVLKLLNPSWKNIFYFSFHYLNSVAPAAGTIGTVWCTIGIAVSDHRSLNCPSFPSNFIGNTVHIIRKPTSWMPHYWHPINHDSLFTAVSISGIYFNDWKWQSTYF